MLQSHLYEYLKLVNVVALEITFSSGVFPDEWKTAIVKPLYKKGDRYDIQNYRPISLISVFAKLLEKLMFNRLKLGQEAIVSTEEEILVAFLAFE